MSSAGRGVLIVNADDWGRDRETTDRTLECARARALSSVSAMMFMDDSQRSAALAREHGVDAGLHLNLTAPFTATGISERLVEQQRKVCSYLRRHALARIIYNPALAGAFEYIVRAQLDEFARLYGSAPQRIDGHHHMHLCANVVLPQLLPAGTISRRNFSFAPGEKSWANRMYRKLQDGWIARRHRLSDYFFSLPPLQPVSRLQRMVELADRFAVEIETHPINGEEHSFLTGGQFSYILNGKQIASRYLLPGTVTTQ